MQSSSSLHALTSGKLPSHSYMLVGKCNVYVISCLASVSTVTSYTAPQVYSNVSIVQIIANVSRPILSYKGDMEVHDAF